MKLEQVTAPEPLFEWPVISDFMALDDDSPLRTSAMLAARIATAYAEERLGMSLKSRSLKATFYENDELLLPRGPLIGVTAVVGCTSYRVEHVGSRIKFVPQSPVTYPLAVTYTAGFTSVPDDIVGVALIDAATRFAIRESISPVAANQTYKVDEFYAWRGRQGRAR